MRDIVIIGGGYAGVLAAIRAARLLPRGEFRVRLIDRGDALVERIRLHEVAAGRPLRAHKYEKLLRGTGVEHVRGEVESLSLDGSSVVLTGGERVHFDRAVYAIGSEGGRNDGSGRAGIPPSFSIGSVGGALAAADALRRLRDGASLAIVGGGLTGIESAAEIADAYPSLRVTLIDAGEIGDSLSPRGKAHLRASLSSRGVTLREHTLVASPSDVDADAVLWCASFAVSRIAADAGLAVDRAGRVIVDDHLRSSDPRILAIGDAALVTIGGTNLSMACATALPMGAYAGEELAGVARAPFDFAYAITCISLGRRDGIVQMRAPDNTARDTIISGRAGAFVKEIICRYTIMSLRLERAGVPYRWPGGLLRREAKLEARHA
ncbi:MAG TPA: FAD-dependent oxidoreductase [Thermoanaerobaculia bacterium]|nr:FAD-dependent oxidoreductase [Thermoanaerobaculia bacterium]